MHAEKGSVRDRDMLQMNTIVTYSCSRAVKNIQIQCECLFPTVIVCIKIQNKGDCYSQSHNLCGRFQDLFFNLPLHCRKEDFTKLHKALKIFHRNSSESTQFTVSCFQFCVTIDYCLKIWALECSIFLELILAMLRLNSISIFRTDLCSTCRFYVMIHDRKDRQLVSLSFHRLLCVSFSCVRPFSLCWVGLSLRFMPLFL